MTSGWFRGVAAGLVLAVLLAACGGGYSPPDDGTAAAPDPTGLDETAVADPSAAAPPAADSADEGTGAAPADGPLASDATPESDGGPAAGSSASGAPSRPSAASTGAGRPRAAAQTGAAAPAPSPSGEQPAAPSGEPAEGRAAGTPAPGPAPAPVPAPDKESGGGGTIKVGGVFPLSGPIGTFGRAMMHSMKTIYAEANESGGIGGRKIDMIVYDDQFDPAQGKRHTQALISQGIFAFAAWTPGTYEAVKEDLHQAKIPGLPMDVGVERQRTDPFSFPPYAGCLRAQAGAVTTMVQRKVKSVAFLELDIEAVHRCMDYVEKIANVHGIDVVYRGNVAPGGPDCGPQVLAARSANPELLLPFEVPLGTIKCLQAVRQQGWDVPIEVGLPAAGDQDMIAALGDYVEGVTAVTPFAVPGFPAWEASCGSVRKYFPETKLSIYSTIGCVSAIVLVKAARAVGPGATKESLMRYLESGAPISTGGVTPDLTYKPGDHRPYDSVAPIQIKGGKWVQTGPYFTPPRLSEDIHDGD